jgi:hypothetical protein
LRALLAGATKKKNKQNRTDANLDAFRCSTFDRLGEWNAELLIISPSAAISPAMCVFIRKHKFKCESAPPNKSGRGNLLISMRAIWPFCTLLLVIASLKCEM